MEFGCSESNAPQPQEAIQELLKKLHAKSCHGAPTSPYAGSFQRKCSRVCGHDIRAPLPVALPMDTTTPRTETRNWIIRALKASHHNGPRSSAHLCANVSLVIACLWLPDGAAGCALGSIVSGHKRTMWSPQPIPTTSSCLALASTAAANSAPTRTSTLGQLHPSIRRQSTQELKQWQRQWKELLRAAALRMGTAPRKEGKYHQD